VLQRQPGEQALLRLRVEDLPVPLAGARPALLGRQAVPQQAVEGRAAQLQVAVQRRPLGPA
jgi:hypothetical protein